MKETKQEFRKQYLYFSESEQELEKAGVGVTMPDHQGGEPAGDLPLPDHQGNQGWGLLLPDHQGNQGWEAFKCRNLGKQSPSEGLGGWKTAHRVLNPYILEIRKKSENHSVESDSLQPHGLYSPWNSPGQNTGVHNHSFLQGIFPTQGSNPGLLHCKWILYQLSYQVSPRILEWVAYPFSSGSS